MTIACISLGPHAQAQGAFLRWDGDRIVLDIFGTEVSGPPTTPADRLPKREADTA